MASTGKGVIYARLSTEEKQLLEYVRRARGVSQNAYVRKVILEAAHKDAVTYADVIARQKELEGAAG